MKHIAGDWLCLENSLATVTMRISFGWVKDNCKQGGNIITVSRSPCYYAIIQKVDSSYSEGKFTFTIVGNDNAMNSTQGGKEKQQGGLGIKGVYLIDALLKAWNETAPTVQTLAFHVGDKVYTFGPNSTGSQGDIFNEKTPEERKRGPKSQWDSKGQDKLTMTQRWIAETQSINKLSWIMRYDFSDPNGKIDFWESRKPLCGNRPDSYFDQTCIGTYIVNGSSKSPVIEFNPKFSWNWASVTAVGGNSSQNKVEPMDKEGAKNPGEDCMPRESVEGSGGSQGSTTNASEGQIDREGANATKKAAKLEAQAKKTIEIMAYENITADLVVVGDPNCWPPYEAVSSFVTIIMVNPFSIHPQGFGSISNNCGDWLATPPCNEILTNKGWKVSSVSHSIEAGRFTTTIGVSLAAPGVHLPAGNNLGGWARGWAPVSC
jgi:hypothetical protein